MLVHLDVRIPHGTISESPTGRSRREAKRAVTHCRTWIPMLAILRPPVHTPVSPGCVRRDAEAGGAPISTS